MHTPWWHPHRHADRRPLLLARNRLQAAIRTWLAARDFVEVDPAAMQVSPGNEAHLHAFATTAIGNDGAGVTRYLNTSPEFAMKKLIAGGERRIHAFAHVWRNRERGPLHAPEFTMLEWYRAQEPYTVLMDDIAAWAALAAPRLTWRGATCDTSLPYERLPVAQAFRRFAGIDLFATMDSKGATDAPAMAAELTRAGVKHAPGDTWSDMFARALGDKVEPHLGHGRLTVLDEYPSAEAALARRSPSDPRVAERFEVYACGVELANGFGELTDPVEQRARFEADMDLKQHLYGERYPLDEDLLAALALMPPTSGCALGFDRLVTLATGAPGVEAVMWAPPA